MYNNGSDMQLVTYNDTYASNHDLPIITPHGTYQSIVTQHNLNNIQHNIFLSNEQGKKPNFNNYACNCS